MPIFGKTFLFLVDVAISGGMPVVNFIGFDNETGALEGGPFVAVGGGVGVNVSADAFVGLVTDVTGTTVNQNATIGPLSVSFFFDAEAGGLVGGTIGLGPGATPIGGSSTFSVGQGLDLIGLAQDAFGSAVEGLFGPAEVPSLPAAPPVIDSLPPGAGGGFVLYPSRPNLSGVEAVYDK